MKPFQTKAVQLVLVAVALVLGYATLASATSTLPCKVSETSADGKVHLRMDIDRDNLSNLAERKLGTSPRDADPDTAALNDGAKVLQVATSLTNADTADDGLSDSDGVDSSGIDPMEGDADGDGLSDGDLEF
jgi:hypothetical protein